MTLFFKWGYCIFTANYAVPLWIITCTRHFLLLTILWITCFGLACKLFCEIDKTVFRRLAEPVKGTPIPTQKLCFIWLRKEDLARICKGSCRFTWGTFSFLLQCKNGLLLILFVPVQINVLIVELKSEALKERHWKQLTKKLNVRWVLSDLTLGHVWDVDLIRHEPIVRDIILIAQGEMALEEFLKQVWKSATLSLMVRYISIWCTYMYMMYMDVLWCIIGQWGVEKLWTGAD